MKGKRGNKESIYWKLFKSLENNKERKERKEGNEGKSEFFKIYSK